MDASAMCMTAMISALYFCVGPAAPAVGGRERPGNRPIRPGRAGKSPAGRPCGRSLGMVMPAAHAVIQTTSPLVGCKQEAIDLLCGDLPQAQHPKKQRPTLMGASATFMTAMISALCFCVGPAAPALGGRERPGNRPIRPGRAGKSPAGRPCGRTLGMVMPAAHAVIQTTSPLVGCKQEAIDLLRGDLPKAQHPKK